MEQGFCNTFVVLPPLTGNGSVIFGKNSDRPEGEVQELVYEPSKQYVSGESLKCTYVEVKQVDKTYAVILSKPAWMWGCEMGANDQGVAIGNGLTLSKLTDTQSKTLLGTDLVRLALERSKTSEEAVDVITNLLEEYGQYGFSHESSPDLVYQYVFLIADANEAWVLETCGKNWVAQKISTGYRNISGCYSVETKFDKSSSNVISFAKEKGFWNGEGEFNFSTAYGNDDDKSCQKYLAGRELLKKLTENKNFKAKDMFDILRNKEGKICNDSQTTGSQVSVLSKKKPCCHWFTATPDTTVSVYKPFIFTPNVKVSSYSKSTDENDGRHVLHNLHGTATSNSNNKVTCLLQDMERNCLEEVEKFLDEYEEGQSLSEVDELLKDVIETEVKFYK
ncbi:Secernin-1, putative [Pediculus humanus corporis]|uniref:Secernin-1, putative n=1 Tax=Pediculus humanus subsp. corporis TaxID=121224 RepID=E0VRF2_PEDHC|nr:Secernin-1, putative [Pediculus humanus corporis]EEB15958.1 Secernin-1, putative [Pediculus humanus corporis]